MAYTMYPCPVYPHPTDTGTGVVHLPQLDGSEQRWIDDVTVDRTNSGAVKMRSFYPNKKKSFVVLHRIVPATGVSGSFTAAQIFDAYQTFYNGFRRTPFAFRWAGETSYAYTSCVFAAPPRFRFIEMRIDVTAEILEV